MPGIGPCVAHSGLRARSHVSAQGAQMQMPRARRRARGRSDWARYELSRSNGRLRAIGRFSGPEWAAGRLWPGRVTRVSACTSGLPGRCKRSNAPECAAGSGDPCMRALGYVHRYLKGKFHPELVPTAAAFWAPRPNKVSRPARCLTNGFKTCCDKYVQGIACYRISTPTPLPVWK